MFLTKYPLGLVSAYSPLTAQLPRYTLALSYTCVMPLPLLTRHEPTSQPSCSHVLAWPQYFPDPTKSNSSRSWVVFTTVLKAYPDQAVNLLTVNVKIFRGCFNTELEKRVIALSQHHVTSTCRSRSSPISIKKTTILCKRTSVRSAFEEC